jgi:hypothetical protein
MPRSLATLVAPALAALLAAPAFAEAGPAPAPAPGPAPQSIPIQITPPKSNVTVRTVTLDAAGAVTPEGQKVLDEMIEDNWRAIGITTVSSGNPTTVAIMFSRTARPPQPPQQPPIGQQPPGGAPQFRPNPQVGPAPVQRPPQAPPPPPSDHNP